MTAVSEAVLDEIRRAMPTWIVYTTLALVVGVAMAFTFSTLYTWNVAETNRQRIIRLQERNAKLEAQVELIRNLDEVKSLVAESNKILRDIAAAQEIRIEEE